MPMPHFALLHIPLTNFKFAATPLPSIPMTRGLAKRRPQQVEVEKNTTKKTKKKEEHNDDSPPTRVAKRVHKEEVEDEEETAVTVARVPDIEDFSVDEAVKLRRSLLQWYYKNRRALPWRTTKETETHANMAEEDRAYAVWVSEVMLQQTRVAAVIGYYNRWMEKWPTVHDLAGASQEEVNEMWAGLGYYRRARFLLEGAKSIVDGGEFPRTASALHEVRGIGDYTAGAIASIAFNEAVPVVDGNVVRVISRLKAISSNPKESATVKSIWKLAGQLVDPCRPGDFNQALMELGATLCSVTGPGCSACPVSDQCRALALSRSFESMKVTDYPIKVARPKQRLEFAAVSIVEIVAKPEATDSDGGNGKHVFLLVKRPDEGLLAGLWEFPSVLMDEENTSQSSRRKAMDVYLKKSFNLDLRRNCKLVVREDVGEYVHVFSHIRLRMHVELLILSLKGGLEQLHDKEGQGTVTWKCVQEESIQSMGLTSGIRKVYNMTQNFKKKNLPAANPKITKRKIGRQP